MSDTTKTDNTTPPISQTDDISVAIKTEPTAAPSAASDEAPKEAVSEKTDIPINPTQTGSETDAPIVSEAASKPTESSDELVSAPTSVGSAASADTPPSASMPPIAASSAEAAAPVVVSPEEVKDDASEHQKLAEEIEILTGEIQALEAKIERLAGNVSATPPSETKPEPMPTPPSNDLPPADLPPAAPSFDPASTMPTLPDAKEVVAPKPNFDAASTIQDIYPKKDEPMKMPDAPAKTATTSEDQPSVLGLIGEVVGVIGIVLFVFMLLSPLYKEMLGVTLWESLRTLGWLSAVGALLVGFLLSLFARGKWALKIVLLVFLILAAALYYSINTPGSFLEPLLGSLLTFYQ